MKRWQVFSAILLVLCAAPLASAVRYFVIDNEHEWINALDKSQILPLEPQEWNEYMQQWQAYGDPDPYPPTTFLPPQLYVHPGDPAGTPPYPEDAGLVMAWGDGQPDGEYASAWKFTYEVDPDLSNAIIQITVTAPQFGMTGSQITQVSFGIRDMNGNIRSWYWNCGPVAGPGTLAWNVPTTIIIDPSILGVSAATPAAASFMNNPMFNLTMSLDFIVDENGTWVGGPVQVPPPGQQQYVGQWNYWHNLIVTPKQQQGLKWDQPPVIYQEPDTYFGWNDLSVYDPQIRPIVADDWRCDSELPVTDIHWWGSFINWLENVPPQPLPYAFHIGIWTDVPAGADQPFSHPGKLVWENICTTYTWEYVGMDYNPWKGLVDDACFKFTQILDPEDWFWQDPGENIYWVSIAAMYDIAEPMYPFGLKTRPKYFQDDAVRIFDAINPTGGITWPPTVGDSWANGEEILGPDGESWDICFQLTTEGTEEVDWGDAPDGVGAIGYQTLAANNGANHVIGGPWLGDATDVPDSEPDGQPDPNALGDDNDIIYPPANDDEDGATIPVLTQGVPNSITVGVNDAGGAGGVLEVWIDFNGDGTWQHPAEQVFAGFLPVGIQNIPVTAPVGSVVGQTFARFRISTNGGLTPAGSAPDGEVEDHELFIEEYQPDLDFGDAPDRPYPTWLGNNGARHVIVAGGPIMGATIDAEANGQPNATATGDDIAGAIPDDEDGVALNLPMIVGQPHTFVVTVNMPCILDAWVDFGGDGSWATPGDQIAVSLPLIAGPNNVSFNVLPTATVGTTFARFRVSGNGGLAPTGLAYDGEVEDYEVKLEELIEYDFGDAPDPTYPTLLASNGARHQINRLLMLGSTIDPEADGQPNPTATGDDIAGATPDDEDGVTFVSMLVPGKSAQVDVSVTTTLAPAYLDAWIDFNGDGDWADAGEQVLTASVVTAGVNNLWINVPPSASPGISTFARFRLSLLNTMNYDGAGGIGEVEDYQVKIGYPDDPEKPFFVENAKWSQPPIPINPQFQPTAPPIFCGWDEPSYSYYEGEEFYRVAADDFRCFGSMPVTSVHWWGSYLGWTNEIPPYEQPYGWKISFWSNARAGAQGVPFSRPVRLLHTVDVPFDRVSWQWVGYDKSNIQNDIEDSCFQYNVNLSADEWFWQQQYLDVTHDQVFWISIVALYDIPDEPTGVVNAHVWGWKTRPWHWMDDAITMDVLQPMVPPLVVDPELSGITPLEGIEGSVDLAFELDTDPNWIKWQQPFGSDPSFEFYQDVPSMGMDDGQGNIMFHQVVADDFICERRTPVSAVTWWGSYLGFDYQACQLTGIARPIPPAYFLITVWTDVPAGADPNYSFSHPGTLLWEYKAYNYDEVLIGYDFPLGDPEPVFRYTARIPQAQWFCQREVNGVFWVSVVAVYTSDYTHQWGWTTHERVMPPPDAAVAMTPTFPGYSYEMLLPGGPDVDMSFVLWTEPDECCDCPDFNFDGIVEWADFGVFAANWQWTGPAGGYNTADLNCDGIVEWADFGIFASYWQQSCP